MQILSMILVLVLSHCIHYYETHEAHEDAHFALENFYCKAACTARNAQYQYVVRH